MSIRSAVVLPFSTSPHILYRNHTLREYTSRSTTCKTTTAKKIHALHISWNFHNSSTVRRPPSRSPGDLFYPLTHIFSRGCPQNLLRKTSPKTCRDSQPPSPQEARPIFSSEVCSMQPWIPAANTPETNVDDLLSTPSSHVPLGSLKPPAGALQVPLRICCGDSEKLVARTRRHCGDLRKLVKPTLPGLHPNKACKLWKMTCGLHKQTANWQHRPRETLKRHSGSS